MAEVGAAYAGCRERIGALVAGLDEQKASSRVPTCPKWSVHDVVAHVSGVVDDALNGRLDGVATDPWTAAQVEARRGRPVGEIIQAWNEQAPQFEALLDAIGPPGRQAVADVVTHEHDLRCALGVPGARDSDAVRIGVGFLAPALVESAKSRGVALRVRTTDGEAFGPDEADVTLTAEVFDILRSATGRRNVEQLRALQWTGDADAVIPAFTFGPFRVSDAAVVE